MASRLPTVGGDSAAWGTVLNDYLTQTVARRSVYIDAYGADPTGVASSDAAWTAAYSAATAAIHSGPPWSGAMIVFGPGVYKFSINTVQVLDARIGLTGQGKGATTLYTTGNNGDLVYVADTTGSLPCLPVGGFHLYGWNAGAAANGLHLGDRWYSSVYDIFCNGWGGAAFLFKNDQNSGIGHEGDHFANLVAKSSTVGYLFDGSDATRAFNYCEYFLHVIDCGTAVKMINQAALFGNTFCLHGAMGSANYPTATLFYIGEDATAQTALNESLVNVAIEITAGSTTVYDFVVNGNSATGVLDCYGGLNFIETGGTLSAGSLGTSSMFRFNGQIMGCPLVTAMASGKKWVPFGTRILAVNSTL